MNDRYLQQLKSWLSRNENETNWVGLHRRDKPSLMPTCFHTLACETAGVKFDSNFRQVLAESIQRSQVPDTGLFTPGQLRRSELASHSASYIRMQATYFSIHALNTLGSRPLHDIALVEDLRNVDYLRGWLDGGPWKNPWLHSNNIMFALTFLQTDHLWSGNDDSLQAYDAILNYLDERQDPQSGLWQPDDEPDTRNAVYAAYHFFPYYFWRGRCPSFAEQIIDSTLSIQDPDGLYGGGACEDLDAVHTLIMMNLVSDHRTDDIKRSLEQCLYRLLQIQNSDGGFWNYPAQAIPKNWKRRWAERTGLIHVLPERLKKRGLPEQPVWCYSGWKQLSCPRGTSDVWGSWFRPLSIKLITEHYAANAESQEIYRSLPGLGWHDKQQISRCGQNLSFGHQSLANTSA